MPGTPTVVDDAAAKRAAQDRARAQRAAWVKRYPGAAPARKAEDETWVAHTPDAPAAPGMLYSATSLATGSGSMPMSPSPVADRLPAPADYTVSPPIPMAAEDMPKSTNAAALPSVEPGFSLSAPYAQPARAMVSQPPVDRAPQRDPYIVPDLHEPPVLTAPPIAAIDRGLPASGATRPSPVMSRTVSTPPDPLPASPTTATPSDPAMNVMDASGKVVSGDIILDLLRNKPGGGDIQQLDDLIKALADMKKDDVDKLDGLYKPTIGDKPLKAALESARGGYVQDQVKAFNELAKEGAASLHKMEKFFKDMPAEARSAMIKGFSSGGINSLTEALQKTYGDKAANTLMINHILPGTRQNGEPMVHAYMFHLLKEPISDSGTMKMVNAYLASLSPTELEKAGKANGGSAQAVKARAAAFVTTQFKVYAEKGDMAGAAEMMRGLTPETKQTFWQNLGLEKTGNIIDAYTFIKTQFKSSPNDAVEKFWFFDVLKDVKRLDGRSAQAVELQNDLINWKSFGTDPALQAVVLSLLDSGEHAVTGKKLEAEIRTWPGSASFDRLGLYNTHVNAAANVQKLEVLIKDRDQKKIGAFLKALSPDDYRATMQRYQQCHLTDKASRPEEAFMAHLEKDVLGQAGAYNLRFNTLMTPEQRRQEVITSVYEPWREYGGIGKDAASNLMKQAKTEYKLEALKAYANGMTEDEGRALKTAMQAAKCRGIHEFCSGFFYQYFAD